MLQVGIEQKSVLPKVATLVQPMDLITTWEIRPNQLGHDHCLVTSPTFGILFPTNAERAANFFFFLISSCCMLGHDRLNTYLFTHSLSRPHWTPSVTSHADIDYARVPRSPLFILVFLFVIVVFVLVVGRLDVIVDVNVGITSHAVGTIGFLFAGHSRFRQLFHHLDELPVILQQIVCHRQVLAPQQIGVSYIEPDLRDGTADRIRIK